MEDGYYWLFMKDAEPEVVELSDGALYRCGSDVTCFHNGNDWEEFGDPMGVVALVGPLKAPPLPEDASAENG